MAKIDTAPSTPTTTNERPIDFGAISREKGSDAIRALWKTADDLQKAEKDPSRGRWVPWRTIKVDNAILPREKLNPEVVELYGETFDAMPPVVVQKGSYVLIGGRTRLESVIPAQRDHIRIVEVDVPDADLWEAAYQDNIKNGQTMSRSERAKAGRRYLREHLNFSNGLVADWAGVSPSTVSGWRRDEQERIDREAAKAAAETAKAQVPPPPATPTATGEALTAPSATATVAPEPPAPPPAPEQRVGRDGRVTNVVTPVPVQQRAKSPADRLRERAEMLQVDLPPVPTDEPAALAAALSETVLKAASERANAWLDRANAWSDFLANFLDAVDARIEAAKERAAGEAVPV